MSADGEEVSGWVDPFAHARRRPGLTVTLHCHDVGEERTVEAIERVFSLFGNLIAGRMIEAGAQRARELLGAGETFPKK